MGCILVGIVLSVIIGAVFYFIGLLVDYIFDAPFGEFICTLGVFICAIGILFVSIPVGIFAPVSGYHETEIEKTISLVSLSDNTVSEGGGAIYVSVSGENVYTYYTEIESKYAPKTGKAYEPHTLSGKNIIIVEDESYADAKLVKYRTEAKSTFWTFGVCAKVEYVFYVPKGTILRSISLG